LEQTTNRVDAGSTLDARQHVAELGAVDVGNAVDAHVRHPVAGQGLDGHGDAQVRAADADVHHVGKFAAGAVAGVLAGVHRPHEGLHAVEDLVDGRRGVEFPVEEGIVPVGAQGHVEHGPVFRVVDVLAGEHALAQGLEAGLPGEAGEQLHGLAGDPVARVVEQQAFGLDGELVEALAVPAEQVAQVPVADVRLRVLLERLPGLEAPGSVAGLCFHSACLRGAARGLP